MGNNTSAYKEEGVKEAGNCIFLDFVENHGNQSAHRHIHSQKQSLPGRLSLLCLSFMLILQSSWVLSEVWGKEFAGGAVAASTGTQAE